MTQEHKQESDDDPFVSIQSLICDFTENDYIAVIYHGSMSANLCVAPRDPRPTTFVCAHCERLCCSCFGCDNHDDEPESFRELCDECHSFFRRMFIEGESYFECQYCLNRMEVSDEDSYRQNPYCRSCLQEARRR